MNEGFYITVTDSEGKVFVFPGNFDSKKIARQLFVVYSPTRHPKWKEKLASLGFDFSKHHGKWGIVKYDGRKGDIPDGLFGKVVK